MARTVTLSIVGCDRAPDYGYYVAKVAQEAAARRTAVEHEAQAEALRLAKLEERIAASPNAARYDLELARLRVAGQLAGNTRAIVTLDASRANSSTSTRPVFSSESGRATNAMYSV